jgi:hypothetical protein
MAIYISSITISLATSPRTQQAMGNSMGNSVAEYKVLDCTKKQTSQTSIQHLPDHPTLLLTFFIPVI